MNFSKANYFRGLEVMTQVEKVIFKLVWIIVNNEHFPVIYVI